MVSDQGDIVRVRDYITRLVTLVTYHASAGSVRRLTDERSCGRTERCNVIDTKQIDRVSYYYRKRRVQDLKRQDKEYVARDGHAIGSQS